MRTENEEMKRILGNWIISGLVLLWVAIQPVLIATGWPNLAGCISFGVIPLLILCGALARLWERWKPAVNTSRFGKPVVKMHKCQNVKG
jgi:hypothetical protein